MKAYARDYTKQRSTVPRRPFRCVFVQKARNITVSDCIGRFFPKSSRGMKNYSRNVDRNPRAPKILIIPITI